MSDSPQIVKLNEVDSTMLGTFEECVLAQAKQLIAKINGRNEPRLGVIMIGVTEPTPDEAHTIHAGLVEPCSNDKVDDEAHALIHKLELMQIAQDSLVEQIKQDSQRLRLLKTPTPTDPSKVN